MVARSKKARRVPAELHKGTTSPLGATVCHGPTDDPAIEKLRNRQVKNFLAVTLLALGTPMILQLRSSGMGPYIRR